MKQFRKTSLRSLMALAFVCACALGVARADVRDARVISARAGGVNLVAGDVKVRHAASAEWVALSTQDELKGGDAVRTGPDGRVEVLLNPGSYFRAGGSTEFTFASADLDDLRVELTRGSAVVEATGYGDMNLSIKVAVPGGVVEIVRGGVYRFNTPDGAPAEVFVTSGRVFVAGTLVKGGNAARVSGAGVEVSKFDKKQRDELDLWSRDRGKELAKANERLNHHTLMTAFSSNRDIFGPGSGFWAYDVALRCYTFLPYGYGWRSPYGYGYGTGLYITAPGWGPYQPVRNGSLGTGNWGNANPGSGNPGNGNSTGPGNGSVTREYTPMNPTPITPTERVEPRERPIRETTERPVRSGRDN